MITKKLMSLTLVLVMCISLCVPTVATATNIYPEQPPSYLYISPVGHGEYHLVNKESRNAGVQIVTQSEKYPELYESGEQKFLFANENTLQAVEMKDLNNYSLSDVALLNLPEEVFSSIERDIEEYGSIDGIVLMPSVQASSGPAYYIHNYRGSNYYMQLYSYISNSIRTDPTKVVSGPDTNSRIDAVFNFALTIGGEIVDELGKFTTAASLLKDFFAALGLPSGTQLTGSYEDNVHVKIWYGKTENYTYVNDSPSGDGNYLIGATTGRGYIQKMEFDCYFYNGGNAYAKDLPYTINEYLYTPSYSKSDDVAVQYHNTSPVVELPMRFDYYDLHLML